MHYRIDDLAWQDGRYATVDLGPDDTAEDPGCPGGLICGPGRLTYARSRRGGRCLAFVTTPHEGVAA